MLIIIDIVIAVALIGLILLQERSAGSSGLFGGAGGMDAPYQTRRGVERIVFWVTVALAVLFALISVAKLVFTS